MPIPLAAVARKELDLLVRTGLGIEPIAPALARILRSLIGAEGCFICWFDDYGAPSGFFHDSAPVDAQELFLNNSQLFIGPNELNVFWLTRNMGPLVGNMMNPGKAFFKSNTFNLLFKACHHHHGLDLRVEIDGVIRLAIGLFRAEAQRFSESDAHRLQSYLPTLQMAAIKGPSPPGLSRIQHEATDSMGPGHLVVSPDGTQITMISEQAVKLLRLAKQFGQRVWLTGQMTAPPYFVKQLCSRLNTGTSSKVESKLDVEGGTLIITASWIHSMVGVPSHNPSGYQTPLTGQQIVIKVEFQQPTAIELVRSISQLELSPLQSRIAMFAATGGSRIDCAAHHAVSKEALKKHLREIYAAARCADWQELARSVNVR